MMFFFFDNIEEWRDIAGYEGMYQVSSYGRVKSLDRIIYLRNQFGECHKFLKGQILKDKLDRYGYPCVSLALYGKHRSFTVHILVARMFLPKYDYNKLQVNHIDGNKLNNNISNLEIVTPQQNVIHAYEHDLNTHYGPNNWLSKLSESDILKILEMYKTGRYSRPDLGKIFGVAGSEIARIVTGKSRYCKNHGLSGVNVVRWKKGKAKFNYEEIQIIRQEHDKGVTIVDLAKKYGACEGTISRVIHNKDYGVNIIKEDESN